MIMSASMSYSFEPVSSKPAKAVDCPRTVAIIVGKKVVTVFSRIETPTVPTPYPMQSLVDSRLSADMLILNKLARRGKFGTY